MIPFDISSFSLDWIRKDKLVLLDDIHKDADAFQQICGDILNDSEFQKINEISMQAVSFPTKGADGAIDHYSYTNIKETVIIECKKNNTIKNCFAEILKLEKKLNRNLAKNKANLSLHKPWFNSKLKSYYFLTSCTVKNAKELDEIKNRVKKMIQNLSKIEGLTHLESIETKIFTWNTLHILLDKSPYIYHKWVQNGILGINYLSQDQTNLVGYRKYLNSTIIPYFSRDKYMLENKETNLPSEKEYLTKLLEGDDDFQGLMIYGEGGIGKTRLMREMASESEKKGWQALLLDNNVDISELLSFFKPNGNYILVFDYIEEFPQFNEWLILLFSSSRNHKIKIIANCRASFINKFRPNSLNFLKLDISRNEDSSSYYRALVDQIILGIPALRYVNNHIFRYRPSFAVFIRFLFDKDQNYNFDLHHDEDFSDWIIRRLELSFKSRKGIEPDFKKLALLFSCMPSLAEGKEFIESNYTPELEILISDGWFEYRIKNETEENESLSVIHDTIADEVLINFLKRNKFTAKTHIKSIFVFAVTNKLLFGCNRAFERIIEHQSVATFDFIKLFNYLIEKYPDNMREYYFDLVKTNLIPEEQMPNLYINNLDFFQKYIVQENFAGPLSFLLNELSKSETPDLYRDQAFDIFQLWFKHNASTIIENKYAYNIISTSLKYFGIQVHDEKLVLEYLKGNSKKIDAVYVITSWLKVRGDFKLIKPFIENWIELYGSTSEAMFLYTSLSIDLHKITFLNKHISHWLSSHIHSINACYVLSHCLDYSIDYTYIKPLVHRWLNKFHTTSIASKVLNSIFRAEHQDPILSEYITPWLHANNDKASFFLSDWLNHTKNPSIVSGHIIEWISLQPSELSASFIFTEWIKSGESLEIIKPYIITWNEANGSSVEASFVFKEWIIRSEDSLEFSSNILDLLRNQINSFQIRFVILELVRRPEHLSIYINSICDWLRMHNSEFDSNNIIGELIDYKDENSIEQIQEIIENWLLEHVTLINSSFILQKWLEKKTFPEQKKNVVIKWLDNFGTKEEASFVLAIWIKTGTNKEEILPFIMNWLKFNATKFDASFVFLNILKLENHLLIPNEYLILWLDKNIESADASYVLQEWLNIIEDISIVQPYMLAWLDKNAKEENSIYLFNSWIKRDGELFVLSEYLKIHLDEHANNIAMFNVYSQIIEKELELDNFEKYYTEWISTHTYELEASKVYSAIITTKNSVYNQIILKWLDLHAINFESRFIITSWLNAEFSKLTIKKYVVSFLNCHQTELLSSFVLSAWLNANGDKSIVESVIKVWLKEHKNSEETSFVIGDWLKSQGKLQIVEEYIPIWLNNNETHFRAMYLYTSWLNSRGKFSFIKSSLFNWLDIYASNKDSSLVLSTLLKKVKQPHLFRSHISAWLENNVESKSYRFIIRDWMMARGEKVLIKEKMLKILETSCEEKESMFLYSAWLLSNGEISIVEKYIKKWLKINNRVFEAMHVYTSWLKAEGDINCFSIYISNWLSKFSEKYEASHVYSAWIDSGGEFSFINESLSNWLKNHKTSINAQFVYNSIMYHKKGRDFIEPSIQDWLEKYHTTKRAIRMYEIILENDYHIAKIQDYILNWLEIHHSSTTSNKIFSLWIESNLNPLLIKKYLTILDSSVSILDDNKLTFLNFNGKVNSNEEE